VRGRCGWQKAAAAERCSLSAQQRAKHRPDGQLMVMLTLLMQGAAAESADACVVSLACCCGSTSTSRLEETRGNGCQVVTAGNRSIRCMESWTELSELSRQSPVTQPPRPFHRQRRTAVVRFDSRASDGSCAQLPAAFPVPPTRSCRQQLHSKLPPDLPQPPCALCTLPIAQTAAISASASIPSPVASSRSRHYVFPAFSFLSQ
jgi:hypothetical protein